MADNVFENEVRQFLFDGATDGEERPQFTLLVSQAGSGRSRIIGRLLAQSDGAPIVLRATDLAPFTSDGGDRIRSWMRDALTLARERRVSVILEDQFESANAVHAALVTFRDAGFDTRVVAVAVPEAERLLAATVRRARARGNPTAGSSGTELITELMPAIPVDTALVIVSRDGTTVETHRSQAARAWQDAADAPLPGRAAAEWISELRRLTDITAHGRGSRHTGHLLDLHRIALHDVLPRLPLAEASPARVQVDERLRQTLAVLASAQRSEARSDETPAPITAEPERQNPHSARS